MTLPDQPVIPIAAARARLRAGEASSAQLAGEALARAADPALEGERVFLHLSRESALQAAREADLRRAGGGELSPLDGIPVSIKDLFDVAGEVTRAGSVVLDEAAPASRDAAAVARLKGAGAVLVGRTNMTEFAYSGIGINPHYGTPANPFDRAARLIPGGSSSGAAVSVASGMACAALASDTGGSARIPAALCGLAGFKPTQRRVPLAGVFPLSPSLDSVGTMAATVADCALLDAVLAGCEGGLTPPAPAGLALAVPANFLLEEMDRHVAATFERALGRLRAAGVKLAERRCPELEQMAALNSRGGLAAAESYAFHRRLGADFRRYDPRVLERIRMGEAMTAAEYLDLGRERRSLIAGFFAAHPGWLLSPTVPVAAPPIAGLEDAGEYRRVNRLLLRNPSIANFLDGCSVSIPCQRPGEAPVGLMLIAPGGADRQLLGVAAALEAVVSPGAQR